MQRPIIKILSQQLKKKANLEYNFGFLKFFIIIQKLFIILILQKNNLLMNLFLMIDFRSKLKIL